MSKAIIAKVLGLGAPGETGAGAVNDLGPLDAGVYAMLQAGSPRLALAKALGVPLAPYIINVRAVFPDTVTPNIPDVGADVKIVQDTLIDELVIRVENQSETANQNQFQAFSDFFFNYQSGIEAMLDVLGAPRYSVAPKYTPLSTLGDIVAGPHWPGGWILTYQQQLQMQFNARVLLPFAPIEVICTFRGWVPTNEMFVSMTNREAVDMLQTDCGITLTDAYVKRLLVR
jgi:hypothetical protein